MQHLCSQCSRARLSSTGWLHGCLSASRSHYLGDVLELPRAEALARIRELSARALADKQAERLTAPDLRRRLGLPAAGRVSGL